MSQVRFARMVAVIGEPITVNSAFLYHLQKALLLALKEHGRLNMMQYRYAEERLNDQRARQAGNHD